MIISAVALEVVYYNSLWNIKEYKRFHERVTTVIKRHNFHVEKIDYFDSRYNQLETVLGDKVSPEGTTSSNIKIRSVLKDNFEPGQMFSM